jgi:hypothetical protein
MHTNCRAVMGLSLIVSASCSKSSERNVMPVPPAEAHSVSVVHTDSPDEAQAIFVRDSFEFTIGRGTEGSLDASQIDRQFFISGGEGRGVVRPVVTSGHEQTLLINRFAKRPSEAIVQVALKGTARAPTFKKHLQEMDGPLCVVDTEGRAYSAVGFVECHEQQYHIRYTPDLPLDRLSDVPGNDGAGHCVLLFAVPATSRVVELRVGSSVVERYVPPLSCDAAKDHR